MLAQSGWPHWTGTFWLCVGYSAVLATALSVGLWVMALSSLPASAAGLGTLAVPVVGVVTSWLQLGERPTGVEATGMVLIIAALALLAVYGLLGGGVGRASDRGLLPAADHRLTTAPERPASPVGNDFKRQGAALSRRASGPRRGQDSRGWSWSCPASVDRSADRRRSLQASSGEHLLVAGRTPPAR